MQGELAFDPGHDLVLLQNDGRIYTYSAHQVSEFRYYNEKENLNHRFKVLNTPVNTYHQQPLFYEVVLSGEVMVYRRWKNRFRPGTLVNFTDSNQQKLYEDHVSGFNYFVVRNDQMFRLEKFRSEIWPELSQHHDHFLFNLKKDNHLNLNQLGDLLLLIKKYNQWNLQEGLAASGK